MPNDGHLEHWLEAEKLQERPPPNDVDVRRQEIYDQRLKPRVGKMLQILAIMFYIARKEAISRNFHKMQPVIWSRRVLLQKM